MIRGTSPLGSTDRSQRHRQRGEMRLVSGLPERRMGRKDYVDADTSPPVWAKSLLTTFQVPSMRTSWK